MPKITIDIDAQGRAVVHVEGVKGPGCHALTHEAEQALGPATVRRPTAEYAQARVDAAARLQV